jgi:hypothetical protein
MEKMMSEIGSIRGVKPDAIDEFIKQGFSSPKAVAIIERWFCGENEEPDFFNYLSYVGGKLSEWDKGRVFDNLSEIRWERDGNGFHLVWIKDDGSIPHEWTDKEQIILTDERRVLLWGERIENKNQWYEKQVPRILEYPIGAKGNRVYAILNEYTLKDSSTVYRFKEVKAK